MKLIFFLFRGKKSKVNEREKEKEKGNRRKNITRLVTENKNVYSPNLNTTKKGKVAYKKKHSDVLIT